MAYSSYRRGSSYQKPAPKPAPSFVMPTFTPSRYQSAILDWVSNDTGNLVIRARAGTGKTATLTLVYGHILRTYPNANTVFLAFNKSIATELQDRGLANASTFHALGYRAVRPILERLNGRRWDFQTGTDANKVGNLFDDRYPRSDMLIRPTVLKLVSLLKNACTMPANITSDLVTDLMDHFDIDIPTEWDGTITDVVRMARELLEANNAQTTCVDFDDMLYLCYVHGAKFDRFDFVLSDESQDLNEIQRWILSRLLSPTSRLIAVGDDKQAIYGFRGASHDSLDLIRDAFSCKVLPLSTSYRCPASVIRLAQKYVPDIEARDNAPEGSVLYPETFKRRDFLPTDLLVCRNTAPLVQTAYKLISARIPCRIMGREIGAGLIALIKKVGGSRATLETLPEKLSAWRARETEKAVREKREQKVQAIADKVDSILALIDTMTADDVDNGIPGLVAIIEEMFDDRKRNVTTLATIHKAKGLEAPRVFIIDAHLMPSKYAKQEWQVQQEHNLAYVAITRALDTLVYVDSSKLTD